MSSSIKIEKNVDPNDVKHFSTFADEWWNENGVWGVLHDFNQVRVPFIVNNLEKRGLAVNGNLNGLKIIDVGCGAGIVSEALARKGGEVVGLDASEELIESGRKHLALANQTVSLNLKYSCELIEDHAEKFPNYYDVVVTSEVVEHIVDKKSFIEGCMKVLKPGGSIFVTTIDKTVISWILQKLFGEYILRVNPLGTHLWRQFISPRKLKMILCDCGAKIENETGFWYFNRKFYFAKKTYCNYGLHGVKEC